MCWFSVTFSENEEVIFFFIIFIFVFFFIFEISEKFLIFTNFFALSTDDTRKYVDDMPGDLSSSYNE